MITTAREEIAGILCCEADEIIFTSCGSESNNLALRGIALEAREINKGNHLIISAIEHPAILRTAQQLQNHYAFDVTTAKFITKIITEKKVVDANQLSISELISE